MFLLYSIYTYFCFVFIDKAVDSLINLNVSLKYHTVELVLAYH